MRENTGDSIEKERRCIEVRMTEFRVFGMLQSPIAVSSLGLARNCASVFLPDPDSDAGALQ